jgi:N-acylneuraminate cytidylyltransferase
VSTEDAEIKRVVEDLGLAVPFLRPADLATDTCGTRDVILHALSYYDQIGYEADVIVLLQATSPFREAKHIKGAMSLYNETCDMVVSVKETKSNPYFVLMEEDENGWLQKSKPSSFVRRQDCPKVYEVNGAIYIIKRRALHIYPGFNFPKVKKYIMEELCSHDIDSMLDWELAELIVDKKGRISDNTR